MKDLFKGVKGHFKAERLDAFDNVIDTPVDDHNMIMTSARTSMAEIFAHLTNVDLSNAFYFGTLGHKDFLPNLPKEAARLILVVVLPTPPFWFTKEITFVILTTAFYY